MRLLSRKSILSRLGLVLIICFLPLILWAQDTAAADDSDGTVLSENELTNTVFFRLSIIAFGFVLIILTAFLIWNSQAKKF